MSPTLTSDIFRKLLDSLTTAVLLLDQDLKVLYLNPAAEHLFATSSSHLIDTPVSQLFFEGDDGLDDLKGSLKELHPFTKREAQIHMPHCSHPATVDYTVTPQVDASQQRTLLIELRPLDRLLRISRDDGIINAHQATRALVRGMAHEVKNPLGGIRGAAQLLARELQTEDLQDYTDIIIAEVDRLRNLVDRMLGPRKLPAFAEINIHEVLEHVKTIVEAEMDTGAEIKRDYDPSLPELWGDHDQLIQATLNIVRNARQALTENAGQQSPHITLRTRALRQFTIGNVRHRLTCVVEIEDNGPGIDKSLLETIFFPMVSGRAKGTGLGLSIAQSIISQHQGLIECESEPGHTIFRLLLPIEPHKGDANTGVAHAKP